MSRRAGSGAVRGGRGRRGVQGIICDPIRVKGACMHLSYAAGCIPRFRHGLRVRLPFGRRLGHGHVVNWTYTALSPRTRWPSAIVCHPSHRIPFHTLPCLCSSPSSQGTQTRYPFFSPRLLWTARVARLPGSRYATIHDSTRLTRLSTDTEAGSVNTICSLSQSQSHSSAPCLCGLRCKELCQPGVRPQLISPVHPSTRPTSAATNLHVRPP